MPDDPYREAFDSAVTELSDLFTRRDSIQSQIDALDERIDKVRQGALGLAALVDLDFDEMKRAYPRLFGDVHNPKLGITEAVKAALQESVYGDPLTPSDVKDRVLQFSPAVAGHKNPMASIHAVLRRLVDGDEALMADYSTSGRTVFGWIGPGTDQAEIRRRIRRWFSNWELVWEREHHRWKDRPEGVEIDESEDDEGVEAARFRESEDGDAKQVKRKKSRTTRSLKN